jgi:hypothetical protein
MEIVIPRNAIILAPRRMDMEMVSYMLPKEHVEEIRKRCNEERVTQDEIVRRAVAEYLAKESRSAVSEVVPRQIHTGARISDLL